MDSPDRPSCYGGRGPEVVRTTWILAGIYTVLLILRTYVRIKLVPNGPNLSLALAYVSYFWGIAASALCTYQVIQGVGNHIEVVEACGSDQMELTLFQWIHHAVSSTNFPVARFSVLAFLLSIQGPTHKISRRFLISICVFGTVLSWIVVVIMFTQCTPPRRLWDKSVPGSCSPERLRVNVAMSTLSGVWGAFTDLCLALYPILLVRRLQMALRVKLLVSCIMGLGVFAACAALLRTFNLSGAPSETNGVSDFTYNEAYLYLFASAEIWSILIAGCIPTLWPLVKRIKENISGPSKASYQSSTTMVAGRYTAASRTYDGAVGFHDAHAFKRLKSKDDVQRLESLGDLEIELRHSIHVEHMPADEHDDHA